MLCQVESLWWINMSNINGLRILLFSKLFSSASIIVFLTLSAVKFKWSYFEYNVKESVYNFKWFTRHFWSNIESWCRIRFSQASSPLLLASFGRRKRCLQVATYYLIRFHPPWKISLDWINYIHTVTCLKGASFKYTKLPNLAIPGVGRVTKITSVELFRSNWRLFSQAFGRIRLFPEGFNPHNNDKHYREEVQEEDENAVVNHSHTRMDSKMHKYLEPIRVRIITTDIITQKHHRIKNEFLDVCKQWGRDRASA